MNLLFLNTYGSEDVTNSTNGSGQYLLGYARIVADALCGVVLLILGLLLPLTLMFYYSRNNKRCKYVVYAWVTSALYGVVVGAMAAVAASSDCFPLSDRMNYGLLVLFIPALLLTNCARVFELIPSSLMRMRLTKAPPRY